MAVHHNNIGFLRLMMANAVIIGHVPQMAGDHTRDPLKMIAPHASLAGLAVSGFFLLSGYLICASMMREGAIGPYLERRVLRIVPGFFAAYMLSVFVILPAMAFDISSYVHEALVNFAFLKAPPEIKEMALPYQSINGSLWTIAHEFRCYILVALLWATGLLLRRRWILMLTAAGLVLTWAATFWTLRHHLDYAGRIRWLDLVFGAPVATIPFVATFLVGMTFYLYRDVIFKTINGIWALVFLALAVLAMRSPHFTGVGASLLLAVPLFWLAFKADIGPLRKINDGWDISYGTYLYGWPVTTVILLLDRDIDLTTLTIISLGLAWLFGALSWRLIEQPTKSLRFIGQRASVRKVRDSVAADDAT